MRTDDLDFELPPERIAQTPAARRDAARLLLVHRSAGTLTHGAIPDLLDELRPGDCVVANNTRVLQARLFGSRTTGGRVEIFVVAPTADPTCWTAMLRAGGRPQIGERIAVGDTSLTLVAREAPDGLWTVRAEGDMHDVLARWGQMPLPPYIERTDADPRSEMDRTRYQTTFAQHQGAVAAPTAGLHVTQELVEAMQTRGVRWAPITLHVGLGTFRPVRTDTLDEHDMHSEAYTISTATADAIRATKAEGARVVAIGTTAVRALEAAAAQAPDRLPHAGASSTDLCIQPGYEFLVVDALLTNFHLPRSTLLALVAAFMGLDAMHTAYRAAIAEGYLFYSYGDAMFIRNTDTLSA